jgi:hypothetical protein
MSSASGNAHCVRAEALADFAAEHFHLCGAQNTALPSCQHQSSWSEAAAGAPQPEAQAGVCTECNVPLAPSMFFLSDWQQARDSDNRDMR